MTSTKATAPEPPYIPVFFETIERSVTLKEGSRVLDALREQLRAADQLRRIQHRLDATIARLTKAKETLVTDKIESVPVPHITITLHPGITVDGTPKERHVDISNGKVPDPDTVVVDTRPTLTKDGIDAEYEELETLYGKLAAMLAGMTTNADYIDALFRHELDIPDEVTSYRLRSTYGAAGYVISVSEPTTTTMEYIHR